MYLVPSGKLMVLSYHAPVGFAVMVSSNNMTKSPTAVPVVEAITA